MAPLSYLSGRLIVSDISCSAVEFSLEQSFFGRKGPNQATKQSDMARRDSGIFHTSQ
jgi:hypothetical protein